MSASLPCNDGDKTKECNFEFLVDHSATDIPYELLDFSDNDYAVADSSRLWEDLTDEEKEQEMLDDIRSEAEFDEMMRDRFNTISVAEMAGQ